MKEQHAFAIRSFDSWCATNGVQVYAPDAFHRCTKACSFHHVKRSPRFTADVFVCKDSRVVHYCGDMCQEQIISAGREGTHCDLTGLCSRKPILQHYDSFDRVTGRRKVHHSPRGQNRQKSRHQRDELRWGQCRCAVKNTLLELFWGKARHA